MKKIIITALLLMSTLIVTAQAPQGKKGERVQQPEFGCDIWLLVFEQIDGENLENRIESSILDAVESWIPNININQIIFDYDSNDIDNNRIGLDIKFSLKNNSNLSESVQINVNN
jgi:phage baseplate assembly protein W